MVDAMSLPGLAGDLSVSPAVEVAADSDLQRADGCGRFVLRGSEHGTCIEDVFERSPVRIMFPRIRGRAVDEAVIVNTGGGVVGGDVLEFSVSALPGASVAVTSQAAERVYRALNEPAFITTRLRACESARLAWLPQETIVFNAARLHRITDVELTSGTELLALEWIVLGRAAHGEVVDQGQIIDTWRVKKDNRLIWTDTFRVDDETFPSLSGKSLLANCTAIATLIYFGPFLNARLEVLRGVISSLGCRGAATLVNDLIVVRLAGVSSFELGRALRSFLEQFESKAGSGPFKVPRMWSR
jgi:urease accessory protein